MTRLSPLAFAGALVATGLTIASSSPAQSAAIHVRYGDLDLATQAGRTAIDARIARAARVVCYQESGAALEDVSCRRDSAARAHEALADAIRANQVQLASR